MNTIQIDKKLDIVEEFLGAFPYDQIPPKPDSEMFSLIINIDPSTLPGDHWTVLLYKGNRFYFFESYGRDFKDATFPKLFSAKIKEYISNSRYKYNTMWLQPLTTNTCGDFCVYFIEEMAKNTFKNVMSVFSTNLLKNDRFVMQYVEKL